MNAFQPRRLGRSRLLIVGAGAVAEALILHMRALGAEPPISITRRPDRAAELSSLGSRVLIADLDCASSLRRLAALPGPLLMLAPPSDSGLIDQRSRALVHAVRRARAKRARFGSSVTGAAGRLVYVSTTGVYGQTDGRWVVESMRPKAQAARSLRRLDAEQSWRSLGASVLRAPGIYGPERLPLTRIEQGQPMLDPAEDGWTNHIAEIDLARACRLALYRGKPKRIYNVSDGHPMRMGDYFDAVAMAFGLPKPPRHSALEVQQQVSPMMWSFMRESRRVDPTRWQREIKMRLFFPDLESVLKAGVAALTQKQ